MTVVGTLVTELELRVARGQEVINELQRISSTIDALGAGAIKIGGDLKLAAEGLTALGGAGSTAAVKMQLLASQLETVQGNLEAAGAELKETRAGLEALGGVDAGRNAADSIAKLKQELVDLNIKLRQPGGQSKSDFLRVTQGIPAEIAGLEKLASTYTAYMAAKAAFDSATTKSIALQDRATKALHDYANAATEVANTKEAIAHADKLAKSLNEAGEAAERMGVRLNVGTPHMVFEQLANTMNELRSGSAAVQDELNAVATTLISMGGGAAQLGTSLQNLAADVQESEVNLEQMVNELMEAREVLSSLGGAGQVRNAVEGIEQLREEAEFLKTQLESGQMTLIEYTKKLEELTKQVAPMESLVEAFEKYLHKLKEWGKEAEKSGKKQEQANKSLQEAKNALAPEQKKQQQATRGGLGVNRSELTSVLSMLAQGRVSITAITQLLFRFGSAAIKALLPVGALFAPIIAGFGFLKSAIGRSIQAVNTATPAVRGLLTEFRSLGTVDLGPMLMQLEQTVNLLKSMSAVDAVGTAGEIAKIADVLQFTDLKPGNITEIMDQINQAIRSGNLESLRGTGIEVDALNAKYENLAEQGMTKAAIKAVILGDLAAFANDHMSESAQQAGREYLTLDGILASIKEGANKIVLNPEVQAATTDLVGAFAALDGMVKTFAGSLNGPLASALSGIADFFRGLMLIFTHLMDGIGQVASAIGGFFDNDFFRAIKPLLAAIDPNTAALIDAAAGIKKWGDSTSEAAVDSSNLMMVVSELTASYNAGLDPLVKAGTALEILGKQGSITATALSQVQTITGLTNDEMGMTIERLLANGRALGMSAESMTELQEAHKAWLDTTAAGMGTTAGFVDSITEANAAIKKTQAEIQQGFGVTDTIRSWAQAMIDFNAAATPQNAFDLAKAIEGMLNAAIDGGAEKLDALRAQYTALFEGGFIPETAFTQLMRIADASEAALSPFIEEAEDLNRTLKDATPAAAYDGAMVNHVQNPTLDAAAAVQGLTADIGNLDAALSRPHVMAISITGANFAGVPVGGAPTGGTTGLISSQDQATFRSAERGVTTTKPPAPSGATAYLNSLNERAKSVPATTTGEQGGLAGDVASAFGLKPAGGGGGGGGGGNDLTATIEQIRALMRAVNEAVAIGVRGGVKIGTEGNVVPFEPGTFLNSQGNQISVDTIVIRGVWDFADPATRRQIVKELEQSLRELKDEM